MGRASLAILLVLTVAAPAAAQERKVAPAPTSVAGCALGTAAPDLRGFLQRRLARAERRFEGARRAFSTGVAAYLYGVAPLSVGETVKRFPVNQITSIGQLVEPEVRTVVAPNVDTTYTVGQLDLSNGPLVINVPDTEGRYYVLQLLDAYSNTFHYIGRRTTGTQAGSYVLVPPGNRDFPAQVAIESPTPLVWLLGRTLVKDEADLPAVTELMRRYRVTPLARWSAGERQAPIVLPAFPANQTELVLPEGLEFLDALGAYLAANPPPDRDACALRAFAKVGIGPRRTPSTEAQGAARAALERAIDYGERLLTAAVERANAYSRRRNDGWLVPLPYIGNYGRNYLARAVIGRFALGANTREETIYPSALSDSRGRPLRGTNRYTIRFPRGELPPVGAFWSLTMYESDGYLYPNPLERYAIGDRTRGLRRGKDGSLTIYVSHRAPAGSKRANWLPAPRGTFRLIGRLYEPRRRALNGDWRPPAVKRR